MYLGHNTEKQVMRVKGDGGGGGLSFVSEKVGQRGFGGRGDYSDPLTSHLSPWQRADSQAGGGTLLLSDPLF